MEEFASITPELYKYIENIFDNYPPRLLVKRLKMLEGRVDTWFLVKLSEPRYGKMFRVLYLTKQRFLNELEVDTMLCTARPYYTFLVEGDFVIQKPIEGSELYSKDNVYDNPAALTGVLAFCEYYTEKHKLETPVEFLGSTKIYDLPSLASKSLELEQRNG
jgi:hypothetical protein